MNELLAKSTPFFEELAEMFPAGSGFTAAEFHARIDSRVMRRHLLASRFVEAAIGPRDSKLKVQAIEARRLVDASAGLSGQREQLLASYTHSLERRSLSLRTLRIYTTAARSLLERCTDRKPLDQETLHQFLRCRPGHAASLGAFVTFCATTGGMELRMPSPHTYERSASDRVATQSSCLRKALQEVSSYRHSGAPLPLVVRVLSLALGLSQANVRSLRKTAVVSVDGAIVLLPECRLVPNDLLFPFAERLLGVASDTS